MHYYTLAFFLVLCLPCVAAQMKKILQEACNGELEASVARVGAEEDMDDAMYMAGILHIRSTFALLLEADPAKAVALHRQGKALSATKVPPLAKLHIDGKHCGGLGDLYYISAVITKQLNDADEEGNKARFTEVWHTALPTFITLLMDSGLSQYSEVHLQAALEAKAPAPPAADVRVRSLLMTPAVYQSLAHINATRALLVTRASHALSLPPAELKLAALNEFSLTPHFYLVYQGLNDRDFLLDVQAVYGHAYPQLQASHVIQAPPSSDGQRTLRIGFVSSHFRRHSICKLFCGVISELAAMTAMAGGLTEGGERRPAFDVTVFSGVKEMEEDDMTRSFKRSLGRDSYVTVGMPLVQNRDLVQERALDVLIFLDVGMEPATKAWAGARLAPVQMVVWGHPSTTGMASVDYFLSSERFHTDKWDLSSRARAGAEPTAVAAGGAYDYFSEQLVQLPGLNFYFERSALPTSLLVEKGGGRSAAGEGEVDATVMSTRRSIRAHAETLVEETTNSDINTNTVTGTGTGSSALASLVAARAAGKTLILCPQHLPKFHPRYDAVLESILAGAPNALVVLIHRPEKQLMWRRALEGRWASQDNNTPLLGSGSSGSGGRILWLPRITADEYLAMLALGDVMVDPSPFGGGVTSLEALSMCVPVVTSPRSQTVPGLTAGIVRALQIPAAMQNELVAESDEAYVAAAVRLLVDSRRRNEMSEAICEAYTPAAKARALAIQTHKAAADPTYDLDPFGPNPHGLAMGVVGGHLGRGYDVGGIFSQRAAVADWASLIFATEGTRGQGLY